MRLLPFFVLLPLAAAFLVTLFGRRSKFASDTIVNLATLGLAWASVHAAILVKTHKVLMYKIGGWGYPLGISLGLDGLSGLMSVVVNTISFLVMLYAISYMRGYSEPWKFHALFMLMLAGLNGIITATDLFSLYVFLELASICGYVLVAFGIEQESLEASFRYLIMGALASVCILLGIALLYSYTSTLHMADIALVLSSKPKGLLLSFVSVLFLAGFSLKAALVPFHAWLPDAHSSAPTPVSAILSGIFIKTLGVYALARVFFNVIGAGDKILFLFLILGVVSMVVGALLALAQEDIKRMFAYSSISQVGYILFAFGVGTPLAILGGLFHLLNHAVFKPLLFLNAGAIEHAAGTRDLKSLGGLSSKLKVTGLTSLIGSMSISGIPPLGGFWSKLIIIVAAIQAGYYGYAFTAVLVSIVTLAYYLKFQTFAFFGASRNASSPIKGVPFSMKAAGVALAIVCVATGLLLLPALRPFLESATDVLTAGTGYKAIVLGVLP